MVTRNVVQRRRTGIAVFGSISVAGGIMGPETLPKRENSTFACETPTDGKTRVRSASCKTTRDSRRQEFERGSSRGNGHFVRAEGANNAYGGP